MAARSAAYSLPKPPKSISLPAYVRQQPVKLGLLRQLPFAEIPGLPQDAGGDVEEAVTLAVERVGEIEKRTHFRIDPDPLARTGRRVYARHDRICTVA